jgi:hypothetical protein
MRRVPYADSIDPSKGRREVRITTHAAERMLFGQTEIDLSAVSQLVDISQTRTIGELLVLLKRRVGDGNRCLRELLSEICHELEVEGLDGLIGRPVGYLAVPRPFEVAAALSRLRGIKFRQLEGRKRPA